MRIEIPEPLIATQSWDHDLDPWIKSPPHSFPQILLLESVDTLGRCLSQENHPKIPSNVFIHLSILDQWHRSFLQTKPIWRTRGRTAATAAILPSLTHCQLSFRTPSQWPGDPLKSPVAHVALKMAQSSEQSEPNATWWLCQELASFSWPTLDELLMWTHWGGGRPCWCFGHLGNLVCDAECLSDFRSRYIFEQPGPRPVWEWAGAQVFLHQNPVSINSSSFYRLCSNRDRVPYSLWASPPDPQPEHLIPGLSLRTADRHSPEPVAKCSFLNSMALSLPTTLPGNTQAACDLVLINPWKSCLESPVAFLLTFLLLIFGFRFWHLHSEELSCNPPFLSIEGVASRFSCFDERCVMFLVSCSARVCIKLALEIAYFSKFRKIFEAASLIAEF